MLALNMLLNILPILFLLLGAVNGLNKISVKFMVGNGFLVDEIGLQNGDQIRRGILVKLEKCGDAELFVEKMFAFEANVENQQHFRLRFQIHSHLHVEESEMLLANVEKTITVSVNLDGKKGMEIEGAKVVPPPEPTLARKVFNFGTAVAKQGINYSRVLGGKVYQEMSKENANKALGVAKTSLDYLQTKGGEGVETWNKFHLKWRNEQRRKIGQKEGGMVLVKFAIGRGYRLAEEVGLECCGKRVERKGGNGGKGMIGGEEEGEGVKYEEAKFNIEGGKCGKCELRFGAVNEENGHTEIYESGLFSRNILVSVHLDGESEEEGQGVYLEDSRPIGDGDASVEFIKEKLEPRKEKAKNNGGNVVVENEGNVKNDKNGEEEESKKVNVENESHLHHLMQSANSVATLTHRIRAEFTLARGIFWHELSSMRMKCGDGEQWVEGKLEAGEGEKRVAFFEFGTLEGNCRNYRLLIKTTFHQKTVQHDVTLGGIGQTGLAIKWSESGEMSIQGATIVHIFVYRLQIRIVLKLAVGYKSDWVQLQCTDNERNLEGNQFEGEIVPDWTGASKLVAVFGFEQQQCHNYRLIIKTMLLGEVKKYEAQLANISKNEVDVSVQGEGKFTLSGASIQKQEYQIFLTYLFDWELFDLGEVGIICERENGEVEQGKPRRLKEWENKSRETGDEEMCGEFKKLELFRSVFVFTGGLCKNYGLQFKVTDMETGIKKLYGSYLSKISKTVVIKYDPIRMANDYTLVGANEKRLEGGEIMVRGIEKQFEGKEEIKALLEKFTKSDKN